MIILLFVVLMCFNIRASYFEGKWFFLCSASALMLSMMIYHQSNWQLASLYFYILFSALYHGLHDISKLDFISVQFYSMKTSLAVISFGITFLYFDRPMIELVHSAIPYLLIANFLFKILPPRFRMMTAPNGRRDVMQGMGGNYSVDSTLVSILYAISVGHHYSPWLSITELLSVIGCLCINRATAGFAAFIVSTSLYLCLHGYLTHVVIIFSILSVLAFIFRKTTIMVRMRSDSGRSRAWRFIWKHIVRNMNPLTGIGSGVFRFEMPLAEKNNAKTEKFGAKNSWWIWAHNDVYQFFIESGLIGLVLFALFAFSGSMSSESLVIAAAIGLNAAINFPFHLAPESFLIAISLKELFLVK